MTIKLNSLDRWNVLEAGHAILFENMSNGSERRIRLHLNLSRQTTFFVENEEGPRFLAVAGPGLETIEFGMAGRCAVIAEDGAGEVQYQTAEGEPTFVEIVDPVIFTKIATRRPRNPELEEIMYRMQINMEHRLAQQAGEFEAALERRRMEATNGRPAETVITDAPGAAANARGAAVQPQSEGDQGESKGESVGAAGTGGGGDG